MTSASKTIASHGDLRVWWIPQVPGEPFKVPVSNLTEAALLLDTLAEYDRFQLENRIKPDYSNAGGLEVFDSNDDTDGKHGSWIDWYSEEGEELDFYLRVDGLDGFRKIAESLTWEGR